MTAQSWVPASPSWRPRSRASSPTTSPTATAALAPALQSIGAPTLAAATLGSDSSSFAAARAITSWWGGEVATGDVGACEVDSSFGHFDARATTTWGGGKEDI